MSEFQLHALLRGVLIPAVVSGVVFILARFTPTFVRDGVRAAGLAAGVALSYILLIGMPDWPFSGSPKGVAAALILASVWAMTETVGSRQQWWRRFIFTGVIALVCLQPMAGVWPWMLTVQTVLGLASGATLTWYIIERGGQQMQASAVNAVLAVLVGTSAAYFGLTGSASLGQIGGALAAGLGAVAFLSLFAALKPSREMTAVAVLTLLALWCCHAFYVDIQWKELVWFIAPLIWFVIRDILGWSGDTPIKDTVISTTVTLLPTAWGLWSIYSKVAVESLPG